MVASWQGAAVGAEDGWLIPAGGRGVRLGVAGLNLEGCVHFGGGAGSGTWPRACFRQSGDRRPSQEERLALAGRSGRALQGSSGEPELRGS